MVVHPTRVRAAALVASHVYTRVPRSRVQSAALRAEVRALAWHPHPEVRSSLQGPCTLPSAMGHGPTRVLSCVRQHRRSV